MSPTQAAASAEPDDGPGPTRSYAFVIAVELIVLTGLLWLGRHFS